MVLEWVLERVEAQEGRPPRHVVVSHPANWGRWKQDVLVEALRLVSAMPPVSMITEPEAAALHYASTDRLGPGDTIAVYDLGGGSFDLSILRAAGGGFEFVGRPEGIERLGGVDFDEVVYRHVVRHAFGGDEPDLSEVATVAALARLREACVDAKESLSFDTRATAPVVVAGVNTTVTITWTEFEAMIRPPLQRTLDVLGRALDDAGVEPADLRAVLLIGGSSRIPLVGQLISGALGRPVAVDAHPKHPVALGAARAEWKGRAPLRPAAPGTRAGARGEGPGHRRAGRLGTGRHPRAHHGRGADRRRRRRRRGTRARRERRGARLRPPGRVGRRPLPAAGLDRAGGDGGHPGGGADHRPPRPLTGTNHSAEWRHEYPRGPASRNKYGRAAALATQGGWRTDAPGVEAPTERRPPDHNEHTPHSSCFQ